MGRRKIAIEAIKDERNRSVTFLKRKGGLFKKAHELSVLCSVDVAVIIFGQNKKLYEFSSGDIREFLGRHAYYDHPHEHKGPADFAGKGGGDDDDDGDDNIGSEAADDQSPPHNPMGSNTPFQSNSSLPQHMMQHNGASSSPPMHNGQYQQRTGTPPSQSFSRPASRTQQHSRRPSSNLVPQDHPNPQAAQQHLGYGYGGSSHFYNTPQMHINQQNIAQPRPQQPYNPQHVQHQQQAAIQNSQLQQMYLQDQRRHSMSPNLMQSHQQQQQQQQQQHQHQHQHQHQQQMQHQIPVVQTPPQLQRPYQSPPLPEPNTNHLMPKAHTIDSSNQLSQQFWRQDPKAAIRSDDALPRSQSIDVGAAMRQKTNGIPNAQMYTAPPAQMAPQPPQPQRTNSTPSVTASTTMDFAPPSRMNSMTSDAKRPRLKVEIPKEASEAGDTTGSSPKDGSDRVAGVTPIKTNNDGTHPSTIVLPPPSPSAGALLSAGATGPTNPFARPPPPNPIVRDNVSFKDVETPMSALPSRFLGEHFSSNSPSSLFGQDWSNYNMSGYLASPATYQPSPINLGRPNLGAKDEQSDKRRNAEEDADTSNPSKRVKS